MNNITKNLKSLSANYEGIVSNRLTLKDVPNFGGMIARNGGRPLITWFDKLGRTVVGTSRDWILSYKAFAKFVHKLYSRGGLKYVVIYLKACSVLLQQSVGGQRLVATQALGCAVSRTISGLPRVIPSAHRQRILMRERDVLRVWLSLFSLYRVVEIPGKLKLSTITDPGVEIPNSFWSEMREFLPTFAISLAKFAPKSKLVAALKCDDLGEFLKENFRAKPFMIAKSSPSANKPVEIELPKKGETTLMSFQSTSPQALVNAALLFRSDKVMSDILIRLCSYTGNQWMLNRMESWTRAFVKAGIIPRGRGGLVNLSKLSLGKLGLKEEAAGKVRVFAMVDAWSQWLLRPLHDMIFQVLRTIPQDGTHDQLKPIKLLIKEIEERNLYKVFSYDLSAATDRLPLAIQVQLLGYYLGVDYAHAWGEFLTRRGYKLYSKQYNVDETLYYAVGQPMGALSSWAMLALTHHFIVQWAAFIVARGENRPVSWFSLYAVLGDDIVIADEAVAKQYLKLMNSLGVEIGLAKSLVSDRRTLEFAKKFFIPEDASLVPFKELLAATRHMGVLSEFGKKHNLSIPDYLHILGFGYKVKGDIHKPFLKLGLRVRKLILFLVSPFVRPDVSLQAWLGMLSLVKTNDQGAWDRVYQSFRDFSEERILQMLDRLDSKMKEINHFVTVKRDREWYGVNVSERPLEYALTVRPTNPSQLHSRYYINYLLGIGTVVDKGYEPIPQMVIDQIAEEVYREGYWNLVDKLREIKTQFEQFQLTPSPVDPFKELDEIWKAVLAMEDLVAEFPIRPEVVTRAERNERTRTPLGTVYSLWTRFSHLLDPSRNK